MGCQRMSLNRFSCLDDFCRRTGQVCLLAVFFLVTAARGFSAPAPWASVGPDGGDVRVFAAVPGDARHLYLGTTTSWVYESTDGGARWRRLARLGTDDSLVVDHILVDEAQPTTIYAAGWTLSHTGGGLWVSRDAGATWSELADCTGSRFAPLCRRRRMRRCCLRALWRACIAVRTAARRGR